jgi:hypothetical protein
MPICVTIDKPSSPHYPPLPELLAERPIAGISLEYEQPHHVPDILRHCGYMHVPLGLLDLGTTASPNACARPSRSFRRSGCTRRRIAGCGIFHGNALTPRSRRLPPERRSCAASAG